MSGAAMAAQAALVTALGAVEGLTGVYDGPPPRAAFPYAAVGEGIAGDWSTKTERGRELRLAITIWDDGDSAAQLHGLIAAAEDAIETMPRDLDGGWRVASLLLLRTRATRDANGPWAGTVEYRMRVLAG